MKKNNFFYTIIVLQFNIPTIFATYLSEITVFWCLYVNYSALLLNYHDQCKFLDTTISGVLSDDSYYILFR